ncbi:MAG: hypothetical protein LBP62_01240 [Clostridiales bacterium]|jgi:hypothetical protein|nr:hypothetical protein [Clostridiales bacterium]
MLKKTVCLKSERIDHNIKTKGNKKRRMLKIKTRQQKETKKQYNEKTGHKEIETETQNIKEK